MNFLYKSIFTEMSFHRILKNFITCGKYNKMKKRIKPRYCYGKTTTCTRFPKLFSNDKPHILPRPYFSFKLHQSGYYIIWTRWFHSLVREIENHVVHYLHNIVEKRIALFNIKMLQTIILECLRLVDSFFTHMSVFGT